MTNLLVTAEVQFGTCKYVKRCFVPMYNGPLADPEIEISQSEQLIKFSLWLITTSYFLE